MPGFDGTGPWGEGPMTGGGRGYCHAAPTGYRSAYGARYGRGRGFRKGGGRGFGRGGGFRNRFWSNGPGYGPYAPPYGVSYPMDSQAEINMLKEQARMVKAELDAITQRMEELAGQGSGA